MRKSLRRRQCRRTGSAFGIMPLIDTKKESNLMLTEDMNGILQAGGIPVMLFSKNFRHLN